MKCKQCSEDWTNTRRQLRAAGVHRRYQPRRAATAGAITVWAARQGNVAVGSGRNASVGSTGHGHGHGDEGGPTAGHWSVLPHENRTRRLTMAKVPARSTAAFSLRRLCAAARRGGPRDVIVSA